MSLNIKNPEAYQLAQELAQLTQRSMTTVVIDALRKERDQIMRQQQEERRLRELTTIAKRISKRIQNPPSSTAHGDMLYDERGLPK